MPERLDARNDRQVPRRGRLCACVRACVRACVYVCVMGGGGGGTGRQCNSRDQTRELY